MTAPEADTRMTFDVAAEDGSGFTPYEAHLPRANAEEFARKVAENSEDQAIFCGQCPIGPGVCCPHGAPAFRYVAVGNLKLQPLTS